MSFEWKQIRLGDHCKKIGSGATPKGGKDGYLESGPFTLIRSQNIYNDGFEPGGLAYISEDQANKLNGVTVEKNDVLLNITGDSVARVCMAPSRHLPARVNQHVAIIRPNDHMLDSRFLRYFLASPRQQDLLLGLASAGATRPALTKVMIENLSVPCPPLKDQQGIADSLSSLDERISLLRETNATLEAIAQALFKSWFVDFSPVRAKQEGRIPEQMDEATAGLFPDGFDESELGPLPRGWRVGNLEECCERVESGGTPKRSVATYWNGGIRWVTSGEVRNAIVFETAETISELGLKESSAKVWPAGTTIVAMYGATAGAVCILGKSATANQACCGLIPRQHFRPFLFFLTRRESVSLASKSSGSAQQNLNKGLVCNHRILMPPAEIIIAYENVVGDLLNGWIENERYAKTLGTIRDTLLPRLISGQLRIGEVDAALRHVA